MKMNMFGLDIKSVIFGLVFGMYILPWLIGRMHGGGAKKTTAAY